MLHRKAKLKTKQKDSMKCMVLMNLDGYYGQSFTQLLVTLPRGCADSYILT